MSKRLLKRILWICCTAAGVILVCHVFLAYDSGLEVFPIEDSGRLRFTDQYDPEALLMIPAAYMCNYREIGGGKYGLQFRNMCRNMCLFYP